MRKEDFALDFLLVEKALMQREAGEGKIIINMAVAVFTLNLCGLR